MLFICFGQEITGGVGVDIAVEALGKPETFFQCTQSVRDGGKAVMVGLTQTGAMGEVDVNRLVRRKVCTLQSMDFKVVFLSFSVITINNFAKDYQFLPAQIIFCASVLFIFFSSFFLRMVQPGKRL